MPICKHELKTQKLSLIIWSCSIGIFMAICVLIFPQMKDQSDQITDMFSSIGSFSTMFGLDKLSLGTITGFYSVESGNLLGIGGALFAAITGISVLMKEERDRTASFLFMHPVSRKRVLTEKLIGTTVIILLLNVIILIFSISSLIIIGEGNAFKELVLIHIANVFLQLEIAGICFGISAALNKSGIGLGIGLATFLYFINLIANMTSNAKFLKYITPFGYTEGSDILTIHSIKPEYLIPGMLYMILGVAAGYIIYTKKDISE